MSTNDAPTVGAAVANTTNEDAAAYSVDLLDGASDVDTTDVLNVANLIVVSGDASGITLSGNALSVNPSAYTALAVGTSEIVTYSYDIVDGNGGSVAQTASVTIDGVNDAPVAVGDTGAVSEDGVLSASGTVTASDIDASDTLSWSLAGSGVGTYGSLSIDSSGSWTYDLDNSSGAVQALNSGDTVSDSFSVEVSDGNGGLDTQSITVDIAGENDVPVFPEAPDPSGVTILTNVSVLGSYGATSGWQTKTFTVDADGTYQISFGAANWYDSALDGNLWIDNLQAGGDHFDFETGLGGFTSTGNVATTSATSTDGSYSARLHTGESSQAVIESFLGYDIPNQTSNGSAMMTDVNLQAGDTVSFDWRFDVSDYMPYNDYAFYSFELA